MYPPLALEDIVGSSAADAPEHGSRAEPVAQNGIPKPQGEHLCSGASAERRIIPLRVATGGAAT